MHEARGQHEAIEKNHAWIVISSKHNAPLKAYPKDPIEPKPMPNIASAGTSERAGDRRSSAAPEVQPGIQCEDPHHQHHVARAAQKCVFTVGRRRTKIAVRRTRVLFDNGRNVAIAVIVNLDAGKIVEVKEAPPGSQPTMTIDEQVECEQAVLASPEFKAALKKHYGIDDTTLVMVDIWSAGNYGIRRGPHAPAGPAALLPAHRPDRQRLRPADRGHPPGRRSQHDEGDPRRGIRPLAAAAEPGELRRRPRADSARRTSSRWRSRSPRGRASRSTATR